MAQFPALPLWTDSFIADTTHLTAEETGGYLMLLMCAWRRPDCDLPDDEVLLQRWSRIDARRWAKVRDRIMSFWTLSNGRWTQKRLVKEHEFVSHRRAIKSDNAKAKWLKNKEAGDAVALRNGCETDAPTPTPTPIYNPPTPRNRGSDRKTVIQSDWTPSSADRSYSEAHWSEWSSRTGLQSPDLEEQTERFRDHHLSKSSRMSDWSAAWRTWTRNTVKFLEDRDRERPGSVERSRAVPPGVRKSLPAAATEDDETWKARAKRYHDEARGGWSAAWGPDLLSRDCRVPPHLLHLFTQVPD